MFFKLLTHYIYNNKAGSIRVKKVYSNIKQTLRYYGKE